MYGYSYIQENDLFDWNENRNRSIEEIKYPMFMYCARCGLIKNIKTESALCPACDISLKPVPGEFLTKTGLMFLSQSARTEFENKIRESAEFDEIAGRQNYRTKRRTAQKGTGRESTGVSGIKTTERMSGMPFFIYI